MHTRGEARAISASVGTVAPQALFFFCPVPLPALGDMLSFLVLALSVAIPFTEAKPHSRLRRTCPSKPSGSSNSSSSSQSSRVAAGWYAGYHSTDFPLADVSWSKYTHLTYSFA